MDEIDTLTIDFDDDVPTKSRAKAGPRSGSFKNNYMLKRLRSVKTMQDWWRTLHRNTSAHREKLQKVHFATFTVSLCIRLAVVAYLCQILRIVVFAISQDEKSLTPANTEELERAVQRDLLLQTFGGYSNIIVCRCGLRG